VRIAAERVQPGTDVQLRLVPGAKHELFSEVPEFYMPAIAATRAWLAPFLTSDSKRRE
jgi:hypothetical protein